MLIQKIKKPNSNFLIFLIFLIIIIYSIPKKIYYVVNLTFLERQIEYAYDFCGKTSTGYIFNIRKKFNFLKPPKIINNRHSSNQYWTFYTNQIYSDENIILLSNHNNYTTLKQLIDEYEIVHNYRNDCFLLRKK